MPVKCIKFDSGWGSAPDPTGETYNATPDSLVGWGGDTVMVASSWTPQGSKVEPPVRRAGYGPAECRLCHHHHCLYLFQTEVHVKDKH